MKKKGGFLSSLFDFIWIVVLIAIAYAFIKVNNIHDASSLVQMVKLKTYETRACLGQLSKFDESIPCNWGLRVKITQENVDRARVSKSSTSNKNGNSKSDNSSNPVSDILNPRKKKEKQEKNLYGINQNKLVSLTKNEALDLLNSLEIREIDLNASYNRLDWKHWSPTQSNCWNTREEVLYNQSYNEEVQLLDKKRQPTNNKRIACFIVSGQWHSPYDGKVINKPSQVDVDHTYPLGRAVRMGGDTFSDKQKEEFANDVDNLVAISQNANRSKGSKGPGEWMPENKESWCAYSKIYVGISSKYKLGITKEDREALIKGLESCLN